MIKDAPPRKTALVSSVLDVPRNSYYAWRQRSPKVIESSLLDTMHNIAQEFQGYGYRRITAELRRREMLVNHKKVLRLMREQNIQCKRKSFKPKTTNSNHKFPLYPNLTKEIEVIDLNQVWVADITYIHFGQGVGYLASIMDRYSRKCIGWEMSRRIDADLAMAALLKAIALRGTRNLKGVIHHSDRGSQYASHKYVECLVEHGIRISMTESGNPRENAFAESFFKTLKVEEVYLKEYATFEDAYNNIGEFIDDLYNAKRLHSSIGYKTPDELEKERLNMR